MGAGTVRIGVVGAGRAGMIHARAFHAAVDDAVLVGVSDPDPEARADAARVLGGPAFADHRELLESGLDGVVVVAPTTFHRDIVVEALTAGTHVLCEKPMAMTVAECEDMIAAAESASATLQIGFMRRFDAGFRRAKDLVDQGRIGAVVMVKSLTRGPSTPRPWMYDIAASNGPLAEVSSHDIDALRWLSGSEVMSLYAVAGNFRSDEARADWPDFYDTVLLSTRMRNGSLGLVDGAQGVRYGYDSRVEILGTHGRIDVGSLEANRVVVHEHDGVSRQDIVPSWRDLYSDAYVAEAAAFVRAIREGTEPLVTGRDGLAAVAIVNAGNESIRTGRAVSLA